MNPNSNIKTYVGTMSPEFVADVFKTDPYGLYPPDRVTSPMGPMVVRREAPGGPTYQEGLGYAFFINSMRYPRIVRMDDGLLVLAATGALHPGYIEDPINYEDDSIILFSRDEGQSWTEPVRRSPGPRPGLLINLGGQKVMDVGHGYRSSFSEDAGRTWSEPQDFTPLPHGGHGAQHGSALVEGQTLSAIFFDRGSYLRQSCDRGRTWGDPTYLPQEWGTSEGALARARDGAMVAALRTGPEPGMPNYSDHWRRITTARSLDNGKTWTDYQVHYRYGKVHSDMLTMTNGDILLTYAARMGELDGRPYHGIEAVLSHDDGKSWDWEHRYILFRWHDQGMHSPQSLQLSDGRILTVLMHAASFSWANREAGSKWDEQKWTGNMNFVGYVSVVIWEPQGAGKRV